MKNRIVFVCLVFILLVCSCNITSPFHKFDYELIDNIVVHDAYVVNEQGYFYSGRGIDTIDYKSENKVIIEELFVNYLNQSKQVEVKIFYRYELVFMYQGVQYSILVGHKCFCYKGVTYKSENNLQAFLEENLYIKQRSPSD